MNEILFCNGHILTLSTPAEASALLCRDGHVAAVGTEEALRSHCGSSARVIDLRGRTVVPAFVDSHSHLTAYAQTQLLCDLTDAEDFSELRRRLEAFAQKHPAGNDPWLLSFGYDQNVLAEGRHPDAAWLDTVFPDHPVLVTHASGHMGVVNSAALTLLGITADTPSPAGGRIGHYRDGRPDGYLEEAAFSHYSSMIPQPDFGAVMESLITAQKLYAAQGITTVQDARVCPDEWALLAAADKQGALMLDVDCYLDPTAFPADHPALRKDASTKHLHAAGYKLFLDGSPQGRTAWLTQPYAGEESYCGYPIHTDEEVLAAVRRAVADDRQLVTHCNGDAAIDQLLRACEVCAEGVRPLRFVVIHAQCLRPDQLPRLRALNMSISFFAAHTWHWGDIHLKNLGSVRAARISPLRSALDAGVPASLHQDTPVIPPNMLESIACAMSRVTKTGHVLGAQERISPMEALQAVTVTAAWQCFSEQEKGRLAPGFRCDLAVLDTDISTASAEELRRAKVEETYLMGQRIYSRS